MTKMRKTLNFVLVLALLLNVVPFAVFNASATVGDTFCTDDNGYGYSLSTSVEACYYNFKITSENAVELLGVGGGFHGKTVVIPSSVNFRGKAYDVISIGTRAFAECRNLWKLTIPNSVTRIGPQAFVNCSSLCELTIPNGVTSIGNLVVEGCISLHYLTIPRSVTSLGEMAFESWSNTRLIVYAGSYAESYAIANNVFGGYANSSDDINSISQ